MSRDDLPVATSSAANNVVVHRAYNRGSGRSRRGHWATSDTLRSLEGLDRELLVDA